MNSPSICTQTCAFEKQAVQTAQYPFGYRALRLRGGNRLRPLWPETLPEPWPSPMELCRRAMKPTTASAIVIKILRMTRRNTVRVQLGLRLTTQTSLLEAWRKRSSTDNAAERSAVSRRGSCWQPPGRKLPPRKQGLHRRCCPSGLDRYLCLMLHRHRFWDRSHQPWQQVPGQRMLKGAQSCECPEQKSLCVNSSIS